jgi:hypothetical protein
MTKILKYVPIIGQTYRDWTVISDQIYKKDSNRATYWKVRCKCGTEGLRDAAHLVKEKIASCKSCAALKLPFEQSYFKKIKERADKKNFEFNLTLDYLMSIFTSKCALSSLDIQFGKHWKIMSDQTASLDRINNTKGYIIGNVQWVHKQVNFMKGTMEQKEFIRLCKLIGSSKCG